ncbi:MAG: hypothetical protein HUU37_02670 [Bdellovibrionales bacterium]|nr:hypothetical protein [Bdellovibrionales bacterium]
MRKQLWLAMALALSVAAVHGLHRQPLSANTSARIFGAFAFWDPGPDQGTLRIDAIMKPGNPHGITTGDWSMHGGHYYSNKAPGSTLLAVPALGIVRATEKIFSKNPDGPDRLPRRAHAVSLLTTTLLLAFAAARLFLRRMEQGWLARDAILPPIALCFGTLLFPFGTSFWGHPLAASFLLLALMARDDRAAGFLSGLAFLTEYLAGISLLGFLLQRRSRAYLIGLTPPVLGMALFHHLAFGNPLTPAFALTNPVYLERSILEAFGHFEWIRLWHLTLGPYRGLFWFCPVLLLAAGALRKNLVFPAVVALYVAAVASFNGWHGGYSTGPRYLIVAIPYLVLSLPKWSDLSPMGRWVSTAAGTLSVLIAWISTITGVLSPTPLPNPLRDSVVPNLLDPRAPHTFWLVEGRWGVYASAAVLLAATGFLLVAAKRINVPGRRHRGRPQKKPLPSRFSSLFF